MSNDNQFLKDVQEKLNNQVENQKKLWNEEQAKAKTFFDDLRQESLNNFEQAKTNIQRHIDEVNTFGKNLQSHFQNQPFDFQSFSKVVSDYQAKQLEIISDAAKHQAQKLSEFHNKLISFYHDKQANLKKEIDKVVDNTIDTTKEVVETVTKKPVARKSPVKKTAAKKTPVKTSNKV